MASTYLTKTFSGSPTNAKKGTVSIWFKLAGNDNSSNNYYRLFATGADSNNRTDLNIVKPDADVDSNDLAGRLYFSHIVGGTAYHWRTNRQLRDMFAFYNLVVAYDTTQASASDRVKIYINGEQETSFSASATIPQNTDLFFGNNSSAHHIGNSPHYSPRFFQGVMSHFHYVDGTSYDASAFGSTDATTGEWKINTSPSVSYGTNGFFILKDGNSVTDQSPNTNNFTVAGGTLTKTEDNPSNNFATFNPLFIGNGQTSTLSKGNTQAESPTSQGIGGTSTLAARSGKFYAEFLYAADTSGSNNEGAIGVCDSYFIASNPDLGGSSSPGYQEYSIANWGLRNANNTFYSSGGSKYTQTSQHGSWTLNDIIGVALDIDNNRVYFSKNGGWWDGTSSWSGNSPTNYITLDPTNFEGSYHFAVGDSSSGNSTVWRANFGNGYFGTTAVSSAGTNASGLGIFEYDVPTGYTALCTKGLNE